MLAKIRNCNLFCYSALLSISNTQTSVELALCTLMAHFESLQQFEDHHKIAIGSRQIAVVLPSLTTKKFSNNNSGGSTTFTFHLLEESYHLK